MLRALLSEVCMFLHMQLAAALGAVQDFAEVGGAAQAVFEVTELMVDECPSPDAVGAEGLSSLGQQLAAAHEAVQDKLALAAKC